MRHGAGGLSSHPFPGLGFQRARPHPILRQWVEWFWAIDIPPGNTGPRTEYIHPNGCTGLVFNRSTTLNEPGAYHQGANIDGVTMHSRPVEFCAGLHLFGIVFKPGALYALFHQPLSLLPSIDALEFNQSQQVSDFSNRLIELPLFSQQVACANHRLLTLFEGAATLSPYVQEFLKNGAVNSSVSKRHNERLLRQQIGLSAGEFRTLQKVGEARHQIKQVHSGTLTDIALATGFYDQAHFNRQFRQVLGITPGEYRKRFLKKQAELKYS